VNHFTSLLSTVVRRFMSVFICSAYLEPYEGFLH
jgi:hypothetical protein